MDEDDPIPQLPTDNTPGNSGQSDSAGASGENNGGQGFNPDTFWTGDGGDKQVNANSSNAGSKESEPKPKSDDAANGRLDAVRTQMQDVLTGYTNRPFFSPDVISALDSGDFDKVNKAIEDRDRQLMGSVIRLVAPLMQQVQAHLLAEFDTRMGAQFGTREVDSYLSANFGAQYNDPIAGPEIRRVFDRALQLNGDDRGKALTMTREMLGIMANRVSGQQTRAAAPPRGLEPDQELIRTLLGG